MIHPRNLAQAVPRTVSVVLAFFALSAALLAQETGKPSISVADVSGDVTHKVVIPVEVSGLEDVLRMALKVGFPSNVLRFVEVRSPMSEQGTVARADLETAGVQGNMSVLSIEVDSTQPIGSGVPVEIVFDPSDEIFENQDFYVSILKASLGTAAGERIEDLDLKDGNVIIVIPLFSCFFYMH
jgi:hypothetical protein